MLNLKSLEYRRVEFDLMLIYKILHEYVDLNFSDFFSVCHSEYNLRKHSFTIKLLRRPCMEHLNNLFMHGASQIWNKLPKSVVSAPTFDAFKNHLKKFDCCSVSRLTYC